MGCVDATSGILHMKFRASLAALAALTLVASCTMEAKQEDDALVKAGFTKTKCEYARSGFHRSVGPDPISSFCAS